MTIHRPVINEDTLKSGITEWLTRTKWPKDFHNSLYEQLKGICSGSITSEGWRELVDILWDWRAIRPKTKEFIYHRGIEVLNRMNEYSNKISDQTDIANTQWRALEPLFSLTHSIKGVDSPVFASKLCHFLRPNTFPVIDNDFIGVNLSYQEYWSFCRNLWINLDDTTRLNMISNLGQRISGPIISTFPWKTKIIEICLAGNKRV